MVRLYVSAFLLRRGRFGFSYPAGLAGTLSTALSRALWRLFLEVAARVYGLDIMLYYY